MAKSRGTRTVSDQPIGIYGTGKRTFLQRLFGAPSGVELLFQPPPPPDWGATPPPAIFQDMQKVLTESVRFYRNGDKESCKALLEVLSSKVNKAINTP